MCILHCNIHLIISHPRNQLINSTLLNKISLLCVLLFARAVFNVSGIELFSALNVSKTYVNSCWQVKKQFLLLVLSLPLLLISRSPTKKVSSPACVSSSPTKKGRSPMVLSSSPTLAGGSPKLLECSPLHLSGSPAGEFTKCQG